MGLDFITEKAKNFRKLWDGGRMRLEAPDLLESETEWEEQHVLFEVHGNDSLALGEELVVQVDGSTLVALRGHDVVATAGAPPQNVLTAVRSTRNTHLLVRVVRHSSISRTADLAFRLQ